VELVATSSGQPFNPGYGTYLVSVKTGNGESFDEFTKNKYAIFGAFTYENLHGVGTVSETGNSITGLRMSVIATLKPGMGVSGSDNRGDTLFHRGTHILKVSGDKVELTRPARSGYSLEHTIYFKDNSLTNNYRELDMIEASRFGNQYHDTNAEFTLQPYQDSSQNVHRVTLTDQGRITLVMQWTAANQPVTFSEHNGAFDLNDLPANPTITWTTSTAQNQFIPNSYYQTFHLNLWQADWAGIPRPTQVILTNFQYDPLK
jgi:hypothetical protein